MKEFSTQQEQFWAGDFGSDYINRNNDEKILASNIALFAKAIQSTYEIKSVIEFGSNIGLNLMALSLLLSDVDDFSAIEINHKAAEVLKTRKFIKNVYEDSILNFSLDYQRDLVLIKGVLIHINPKVLSDVYDLLYSTSRRYILIAEYYNPTPIEILYRGHKDKLFKRDFAGELMDKYSDLELVDYGFIYHRDSNFPQDDLTWFLLEKTNPHEIKID